MCSSDLIENLINGSSKFVPNIKMNLADVRDVAEMHILAMANPAAIGQRFIAISDQAIAMPEIAKLIRAKHADLRQVAKYKIPGWLIKLAALFNQTAKEGRLFLEINHHVSTQKARVLLNWQPKYHNRDIILSAVDAIINQN